VTDSREYDRGAKIRRIERALEKPEAALKQIGAMMVAESQQSFRDQTFGTQSWDPRAVPNTFGIISDFYNGRKEPPKRRFEPRPALKDTGRLAASIAFQLVGTDAVEVGTNLPYAAAHHNGEVVQSEPITQRVVDGLNKWLKGKGAKWKNDLGFLLNKKFLGTTLETQLPERPMVGITAQTIDDIVDAVGVLIAEDK
jgi:phage gpG-like protein